MSRLPTIAAPLRRLASDSAGQAVVTYAIVACLFAAALVVGSYAWKRDGAPADPPVTERGF